MKMIKAIFYFEDDTVSIHSENTKDVRTTFRPGFYNCRLGQDGNLLIDTVSFKEIHKPFPNQRYGEVLDTVNKFLIADNKTSCNEMGYTYKVNFLLHGKQGSGKTALINYICDGLIKTYNAIVFRLDSISNLEPSWSLGEEIRKIQDNPIVFIFDEFEQYCNKSSEAYIKNILDGNRSINNSIVFAATNYIDRVPDTIRNRPSRFRVICQINPIEDFEIINKILEEQHAKVSNAFFSKREIVELAKTLKGSTVDEIKTILLDKLMNIQLGLDDGDSKIGFSKTSANFNDDTVSFEDVLKLFNASPSGEKMDIFPNRKSTF